MRVLKTYRIIPKVLLLFIIIACSALKTTQKINNTENLSSLVTFNGIYNGDITPEELRSTTRFKIFPDSTIDKVLSYKILSFDNGAIEFSINSDSITHEARKFILSHNKLGDKFYITDFIVKYQNSIIDTLNSISLRLVKNIDKKQQPVTNPIGLRANLVSRLLRSDPNVKREVIKIVLNHSNYTVTKFTCILPECDNSWRTYSCRGDTIPDYVIDKLKNCNAGSHIIFEDITVVSKFQDEVQIPVLIIKLNE